jgi:hypothetical protein
VVRSTSDEEAESPASDGNKTGTEQEPKAQGQSNTAGSGRPNSRQTKSK